MSFAFMIKALDNLSESSLPNLLYYLVPISNVIALHQSIVPIAIIKAIVD